MLRAAGRIKYVGIDPGNCYLKGINVKGEKDLSSIELRFVGSAEDHFTKVLRKQMELHEGVTLLDLLKFLYQSSLGSFHLFEMMDETEMLNWIRKNLEKTEPSDGPLVEKLHGKKWIRLNFGPYKKAFGNDYRRIYRTFVKAKKMKQGQPKEFEELVKKLFDAFQKGKLQSIAHEPKTPSLVEDFLKEYEEEDYPPIHHSKVYVQKNSSDYLVVPCSSLDEITQHNCDRPYPESRRRKSP